MDKRNTGGFEYSSVRSEDTPSRPREDERDAHDEQFIGLSQWTLHWRSRTALETLVFGLDLDYIRVNGKFYEHGLHQGFVDIPRWEIEHGHGGCQSPLSRHSASS